MSGPQVSPCSEHSLDYTGRVDSSAIGSPGASRDDIWPYYKVKLASDQNMGTRTKLFGGLNVFKT